MGLSSSTIFLVSKDNREDVESQKKQDLLKALVESSNNIKKGYFALSISLLSCALIYAGVIIWKCTYMTDKVSTLGDQFISKGWW